MVDALLLVRSTRNAGRRREGNAKATVKYSRTISFKVMKTARRLEPTFDTPPYVAPPN
jgi:hypothetical protein